MTGTRTAAVTADCARCVPNAHVIVGVICCVAKIALSNSYAALGVFSLAHNRGMYGAFMHLFLSPFVLLNSIAWLIECMPYRLCCYWPCAVRRTYNRTATHFPLFYTVLPLHKPFRKVSIRRRALVRSVNIQTGIL